MGTKAKAKKRRSSAESNQDKRGDSGCNIDKEKSTKRKRSNRWLKKMTGGKRKSYRTLSEERLHEKYAEEPMDGVEGPSTSSAAAASVEQLQGCEKPSTRVTDFEGFLCEINMEGDSEDDEILSETDECGRQLDIDDDLHMASDCRKDEKNSNKKKTFSFRAVLRVIRDSLSYKKRRKHSSTVYKNFSETGSTENLSTATSHHLPPTPPPSPSPPANVTRHPNLDDAADSNLSTKKTGTKDGKKRNKSSTTKYVRFATVSGKEDGDDGDNENVAITIEDNNGVTDDSTSVPKKKKKSTRKGVAKAGRKTGRVLGMGLIQVGMNLQYLAPVPTSHVFGPYSESSSKSSSSKSSGAGKPYKSKSYKHTARAPPADPYAFI